MSTQRTGVVGIEAMGLSVPEQYLDMAELAGARGVAPSKYLEGIGLQQMAVPGSDEDTVTLAVRAARMALRGTTADQVGLCIVGTETAVDHSKPVTSFVQGLLGLPTTCRVYETKHACYGGTAGLMTALDWIRSGSNRGKKALVIAADIARYGLRTPGEPTQGAGAVAMLISDQPKLVELDQAVGTYATDVMDFWRPLYSKDAVVDGQHSVQCYLDALSGAWRAYLEAAAEAGVPSSGLVRRCYHVPYGKMARKAHRQLCALDGRGEEAGDASFGVEVASSLRLPSQVGNVYTGSLYLSLASLLHAEAADLEGQRIGLFSYGSGCAAEYFAARVVRGAGAFAASLDLAAPLAGRRRLSVAEYEAIRAEDHEIDKRPVDEKLKNGGGIAFLGVSGDKRVYAT